MSGSRDGAQAVSQHAAGGLGLPQSEMMTAQLRYQAAELPCCSNLMLCCSNLMLYCSNLMLCCSNLMLA